MTVATEQRLGKLRKLHILFDGLDSLPRRPIANLSRGCDSTVGLAVQRITFMIELNFPLIGCDNSNILSLRPLTVTNRRDTFRVLDRLWQIDWKDSATWSKER